MLQADAQAARPLRVSEVADLKTLMRLDRPSPQSRHARMTIFENDGDYEAFERVLEEAVDRMRTWLPAYCVMPFVPEQKKII